MTKIAINFHARGNELFTPHPAQAKARKLRARHVSNKVKYLLSRDDTNSDSFLKLFAVLGCIFLILGTILLRAKTRVTIQEVKSLGPGVSN